MDNRISQLSIQTSMDRTAVKSDFGALLARGISTGVGVASAIVPGGAVISAAVNQTVGQALSHGAVSRGGSARAIGGGGTAPISGNTEQVSTTDEMSFAGQSAVIQQQKEASMQYLALQNKMQAESREFNAISNILKVRHESAKTAINNVR